MQTDTHALQTKASSRAATKLSGRIVNCSCYEI